MSDGIDFSNEGLSERVEGGEPEVGEQEAVEESAEDTVNEAGGESEPSADVAEADGEASEEPAAEVEPGVDEQPEADPYEARYQEAQKVIGRQGQELGELRKMVEQLQQATAQPELEPEPVFRGRVPQTQHELIEMAASGDEAYEAYEFALQHAPHLLPNVIAEVQAYDPAWAEQMRMDAIQRQVEAQYAPIQQSMQQATIANQQAQAVQQITSQIEGFDQVREQVAQLVEQMPHLMGDGSPQAIKTGLEFATRLVRAESGQVAQQQVQQQAAAQSQQMRQQAAVETGTPAAAPPPADENPADQIKNAIFAQDQQRRQIITGL